MSWSWHSPKFVGSFSLAFALRVSAERLPRRHSWSRCAEKPPRLCRSVFYGTSKRPQL